jgi:secreted Zn-dependent insulinase-like peptidase
MDKYILTKLVNNNIYPLAPIKQITQLSIKHPNKNEKSNCVTFYYKIGYFIPLNHLLLKLTINILNEWFFDILRTKYQLGYLVLMNYIKIQDNFFIIQKIQSTKPIDFIESKINDFNNNILKKINELDISNYIKSLKNDLLEKSYTIEQKIIPFITEINNEKYFFNKNDVLLYYIDKINKNNLIEFIKTFIINNECIKINIYGN